MRFPLLLTAVLGPLLLAGCLPTLPERGDPAAGTYRVPTDLRFQLDRRDFLLHVPSSYRPEAPLPLVVVLHGAFSTARQTEEETGFSRLADAENFLVAYPEGIGLFGLLQHWNAGHCCGKAATDGIDDVGFVAAVVAETRERLAVDPARVYLAGMSNGGMLAYRFAAERPRDLAAVAVVAGALGSRTKEDAIWRLPTPEAAVPVIAFHGLTDEHIPPEGGTSPRKGGGRTYRSLAEAMEFWRLADGCAVRPQVEQHPGLLSFRWDRCRGGSAVESHLLEGWGHQWPAPHFTSRLEADHPLYRFDATAAIWDFFTRFARTP